MCLASALFRFVSLWCVVLFVAIVVVVDGCRSWLWVPCFSSSCRPLRDLACALGCMRACVRGLVRRCLTSSCLSCVCRRVLFFPSILRVCRLWTFAPLIDRPSRSVSIAWISFMQWCSSIRIFFSTSDVYNPFFFWCLGFLSFFIDPFRFFILHVALFPAGGVQGVGMRYLGAGVGECFPLRISHMYTYHTYPRSVGFGSSWSVSQAPLVATQQYLSTFKPRPHVSPCRQPSSVGTGA